MEATTTQDTTQKAGWNEAVQASADAQAAAEQDAHPPRKGREMLPVKLTDTEIAACGKRAAKARTQIAEFEEEKSKAASHWKEKINDAEKDRDDLLDAISKGTEDRYVETLSTFEIRTGSVTVTRTDTGERVRVRPMTGPERQPGLPGTEPELTRADFDEHGVPLDTTAGRIVDEEESEDNDGTSIVDPQATLDGAVDDGADAPATKTRRKRKGS